MVRFKPGTVVEGRVRNVQPFGAFVELAEGIDGMIHIGDLAQERINHPSEKVQVGETVKAQVLEIDREKRRIRLGVKQLLPTPMDEYITGHEVGQTVTGRVLKAYPGKVELDEGIVANCPSAVQPVKRIEEGSLAAKLAAVWKPAQQQQDEAVKQTEGKVQLKVGEVRSFRLTALNKEDRRIEVEPA
jgi:small subunit ribosomal protein S1